MSKRRLSGITWDDPRGWGPINELTALFRQRHPNLELAIDWDIQPLEGFESRPITELARAYDLITLDHPHIPEAVAADCLLPIAGQVDEYVGASLASYSVDDNVYAVPVDAACQIAVYHSDRIQCVPHTFAEVVALAKAGCRVGAAFRGIHALMALLTTMAQSGLPSGETLIRVPPSCARVARAYERLRELAAIVVHESFSWNPIELHRAIAIGDCDYAPFSFAYVNAARDGIRFAPVPVIETCGDSVGAVLGGTGLAVSAYTECAELASEFARFAGAVDVQTELWPRYGGQPAHREAWQRLGKHIPFYRDVLPAIESAWIRPRMVAWNELQSALGQLVESALRSNDDDASGFARAFCECWHARLDTNEYHPTIA